MTPPRVTACVVSHGDAERLAGCLAALRAQRGVEVRTVVVCNVHGDGSAAAARAADPSATLVERTQPRGFGENVNTAAAAERSPYVITLNPDVLLEPDCIAELVALLDRHPRCGIAAPVLVNPDGTPQHSARQFPRGLDTLVRRTPLRALRSVSARGRRHLLPDAQSERRIDWALGACLLVRGEAWRELGGFDERFRLYVEDIDLAWRAREAGWEAWQTPTARAVHEYQAVIDRSFLTRRTWWHLCGMLRFVQKHPRAVTGAGPRSVAG